MSWNRLTTDEFVEKAIAIHGSKYDYSRVYYIEAKKKVIIGCPVHGWFEQRPNNHLYNGRGCSVCARGGTIKERFLSSVDKEGPKVPYVETRCWQWTGGMYSNGYGRFWMNGKSVKANRAAFELFNGSIPEDDSYYGTLFVLHKCDNKACVNPEHLFLGTAEDNMQDMSKKGRCRDQSGERNNMSVLTWDKVRRIRQMYSNGGFLQTEIACQFGVSPMTVNDIVHNRRWIE